MERAFRQGAIDNQLLMNHRAYADLEKLPSKLIYDNKMVSGIKAEDRYPPSVQHVMKYMSISWVASAASFRVSSSASGTVARR